METRRSKSKNLSISDPLWSADLETCGDDYLTIDNSANSTLYLMEASKRKKKRKHRDSSSSSSGKSDSDRDGTDDEDENNYFNIKVNKKKVITQMQKLEQQNKSLISELKTCKAELSRMREENVVLRDANIQFQVQIFKLRMQVQNAKAFGMTKYMEEPKQEAKPSKSPKPVVKQAPPQKVCEPDTSIVQYSSNDIDVAEEVDLEVEREQDYESHHEVSDNDGKDDQSDDEEDEEEKDDPSYDKSGYIGKGIYYTKKHDVKLEEQDEIQNRFKIRLGPIKLAQLNDVGTGPRCDGKFINMMMTWLFDRQTLLVSTVTGKKYKNKEGILVTDNLPLDKRKMAFMRAFFTNRVYKEKMKPKERETRLKRFHKICKTKLNNVRLSEKRQQMNMMEKAIITKIETQGYDVEYLQEN